MNELYLKRIMLKEDCEAEKSYVWALPVVRHLKEITLRSPRHLFLWGKWNGKVHIARGAGCALRL